MAFVEGARPRFADETAALERVIIRSLAKMPSNRYQDMESVDKALGECACTGKWTKQMAAAWWLQIKK